MPDLELLSSCLQLSPPWEHRLPLPLQQDHCPALVRRAWRWHLQHPWVRRQCRRRLPPDWALQLPRLPWQEARTPACASLACSHCSGRRDTTSWTRLLSVQAALLSPLQQLCARRCLRCTHRAHNRNNRRAGTSYSGRAGRPPATTCARRSSKSARGSATRPWALSAARRTRCGMFAGTRCTGAARHLRRS